MKMLTISMMLAFSIASGSAIAQAQRNLKPVICMPAGQLITEIEKSEYKEKPYWVGIAPDGAYTLMVNTQTKTWTLFQFSQGMGCIIGGGSTFEEQDARIKK